MGRSLLEDESSSMNSDIFKVLKLCCGLKTSALHGGCGKAAAGS